MEAFFNFLKQIVTSMSNLGLPVYLSACLVLFAMTGTQALKIPYKLLTNKIPNETLRKKVNLGIWLMPILLGVGAMFIISRFGHYGFNFGAGAIVGFASESLYELISKLCARISSGEDVTEEAIAADVEETTKDVEKAQAEFDKMVAAMKKANAKASK